MVRRNELKDVDISISLKYGIHTIFLFVDPMKPLIDVAEELLEILTERYPKGLTSFSLERGESKIELPDDPEQIEFALPKVANDFSQGWDTLDSAKTQTPVDIGLANNNVVAFTFKPSDADSEYEPEFQVDVPDLEDVPVEE
ncbi:uncharacterized protein GGS22DRAFT_172565 [Annulohypoxylon maeteangense]|uniref:uncharacterized protein n=1 Tax=Annulohypoxylon maeteangense TaxID=1927788 RepID=UPI00200875B7|nr:uncharacterized protein GGS22DRAFT_172565 [Annulohypoxylon maeteangense]KAI0881615.1 hypothetical protein GGS22DRAFT_172565 [Annulohypoxylon maeteangense]